MVVLAGRLLPEATHSSGRFSLPLSTIRPAVAVEDAPEEDAAAAADKCFSLEAASAECCDEPAPPPPRPIDTDEATEEALLPDLPVTAL